MKDFRSSVRITVRIGDINYGRHVGYQNYLLYFQEARIAYLGNLGYSELDIEGTGMIVSEAKCRYRRELFLGDVIDVGCRISEIRSKTFVMDYRIERSGSTCAVGATVNLCFDYAAKRVVPLPGPFLAAARGFENAAVQVG